MPFLTPSMESLAVASVAIGYGLRWERHYTAWISVVMNMIFTAILAASVDLPGWILAAVVGYIALGFIAARQEWRTLFPLFGEKTFGALSLTIALGQFSLLGWANKIWIGVGGLTTSPANVVEYLVGWVVIAAVIHILGFIFFSEDHGILGI